MSSDQTLNGYRLKTLLMSGQTTQVWEAVQESSNRHFAVKLLLPHKVQDREHRQSLFHEARVAMQLVHPEIIRVTEMVKERDNPFLVMELFQAPHLKALIKRSEPLVRQRVHELVCRIAGALSFVHEKGWVHRDVKPENVLVNRVGQIRLIDFSLAIRSQGRFSRMLRRNRKIQGTLSYMAPEQILRKRLTTAADIYGLGALLFELGAGRPPFIESSPNALLNRHVHSQPTPPSTYTPELTPEFDEIVLRMLSKKPKDRFKSMQEFLNDFREVAVFQGDSVSQKEAMG